MEAPDYRDNLEAILEFSGGRHLLSKRDVCAYCGITDQRTVTRRFPFKDNVISAPTLARAMCSEVRR